MNLGFVCYRRINSHAAGRISDRLTMHFGRDSVFRDVGAIPCGATFRDTILAALATADVVVLVIGDRWLRENDASSANRLCEPEDFVRLEIETALRQGIPIVPVLIDGVEMPQPEDLPLSVKGLAGLQFARVRDSDFDADVERLFTTINALVGRKRVDIPIPAAGEPVTGEHLVLKHTSWRMRKLDEEHMHQVYGFAIILDGDPSVLDRVTSVLYLLPPAWQGESPKRVGSETPRFELKNLAWSDLVVRARVYIRDQGMPVFLSAFVRLTETGPRVHEMV
jgi:hypothetical protein